jgi:hypothetical protein
MSLMRVLIPFSAAVLLSLACSPLAAQDQQQRDLETLKGHLLQLRVNPYPPARERTAQLLVAVVRRMDASLIDRATIDEVAGFLEDNSDVVRGRMAVALGNLGAPAKHTIPALEKAFVRAKEYIAASQAPPQPQIGNRNYGLGSSADSICFALARLDAAVPQGCVDGRYDPQLEPSARGLSGPQ